MTSTSFTVWSPCVEARVFPGVRGRGWEGRSKKVSPRSVKCDPRAGRSETQARTIGRERQSDGGLGGRRQGGPDGVVPIRGEEGGRVLRKRIHVTGLQTELSSKRMTRGTHLLEYLRLHSRFPAFTESSIHQKGGHLTGKRRGNVG